MGMTCPLCKDPTPKLEKRYDAHLVMAKQHGGGLHVHGDLHKKEEVTDLIEGVQVELGLTRRAKAFTEPEVIFHNRQRIGDALMFTCGVRDFKRANPNVKVNVLCTAMHIWDHNPYIDPTLKVRYENELVERTQKRKLELSHTAGKEVKHGVTDELTIKDFPKLTNVVKIGPSRLTNASNRLDWHFANAYRVSIEDALGLNIPQGDSRPDIWLTEEEYNAPRITKDPYWIIIVGGEKGWGCKMYPIDRWQWVVDHNPEILFYQLGTAGDNPARLKGNNVVDYVGKTEDKDTGIRDLFKLFLNAEGSMGLVSFHMHLSGALLKPSVVVAGAREPVSFTRYPGHQYLANDGTLPCSAETACWHCDINACTNLVNHTGANVPKCVDMIPAEEVSQALRRYYLGGRLKMGVPLGKTPRKYMNLVKEPTHIYTAPPKEKKESKPKESGLPSALQQRITRQYGKSYPFAFGGGSITEKDWKFMQSVIDTYGVKSILEFGAGLSTFLFSELCPTRCYETMPHWIKRMQEAKPGIDVRPWDGRTDPEDLAGQYDLAFVDGPSGGENREHSTRIAASKARMVISHDGNYAPEQGWQAKYLKGRFKGPIKGGDRCFLWLAPEEIPAIPAEDPWKSAQRAPAGTTTKPLPDEAPFFTAGPKPKYVKIVSTARGWGGCARSVTTIMRMLMKAGHRVEFVPFRNSIGSREFKVCIQQELNGLLVTLDYSTIKDPCDALLVYADDFVWEFDRAEIADAFSDLKAARKIMMVNYRRGRIGEIPWTKGWDLYAFLNSDQEKDLLRVLPDVQTAVLPPCTMLDEFFKVSPNYNTNLRVVRHNSQGDTKFASGDDEAGKQRVKNEIESILQRESAEIYMLPGPSFVPETDRFKKAKRTASAEEIAAFLSKGNVFWYSLPPGYMDMGPRVILEAMAAGLPIVADRWGGAVDRVTPDTGWLCESKEEMIRVLTTVTAEELKAKGEAARERARKEFVPERWLELILG